MCGSCFSQALSSFVGEAAPPTQQGATLHLVPYGGLAPSAAPLLRNAAPLYGYTVYITCKVLDSFAGAADKVSPVRLYMADNGPHSAGCAPQSALWCRQQGLNLQAPGYEPGVLPLNYSDTWLASQPAKEPYSGRRICRTLVPYPRRYEQKFIRKELNYKAFPFTIIP